MALFYSLPDTCQRCNFSTEILLKHTDLRIIICKNELSNHHDHVLSASHSLCSLMAEKTIKN